MGVGVQGGTSSGGMEKGSKGGRIVGEGRRNRNTVDVRSGRKLRSREGGGEGFISPLGK